MRNSDRFIALNVGMGDAFYLERDGFSCLVDGGLRGGFADKFRRVTRSERVDVVVCTHNDSDHVNGLIDFFNNGGMATECWLPATWMEPLQMLLECPELALEQIFLVDRHEQNLSDCPPPAIEFQEETRSERDNRREGEEVSASQLKALLENRAKLPPRYDGFSPGTLIIHRTAIFFHPFSTQPDSSKNMVGLAIPEIVPEAILADNIMRLAIAATRSAAMIRWFGPLEDPQRREPAHKFLRIVNAAQVNSVSTIRKALPDLVQLTQVNRNSLVLHSPAGTGPDVLFSSDSSFQFQSKLPVGKNMLVTAPHHGSTDPENEKAYRRLKKCEASNFRSLTWVRSDKSDRCNMSSRPGKEYLNQTRRYCTNCRGHSGGGQDVIMRGDSCWKPSHDVCPCCCSKKHKTLADGSTF